MNSKSTVPPPIAIISGGSSGIGLHCAKELADRGYHVVLIARDQTRLANAQLWIKHETGAQVTVKTADVSDHTQVKNAIDEIAAECGRIDWLITSAGIAEPGMFAFTDLDCHRRQMETNYFGTLNLVHASLPYLRQQHDSRITLVASAAAFVGVIGYSAYAPSKFAVRALGEILSVELNLDNIKVSVAYPPDTDTPQLRFEEQTKPEATKIITKGGGLMSPERVAREIIRQALLGRTRIAPSKLMLLFSWVHSLYAPFFLRRQARVLRQHNEANSGR